jgi:hypothetical protein
MEESRHLHVPAALTTGKELWYPLDARLGDTHNGLDDMENILYLRSGKPRYCHRNLSS